MKENPTTSTPKPPCVHRRHYGFNIEVDEEYIEKFERDISNYRRAKNKKKRCACPRALRRRCTTRCEECKFRIPDPVVPLDTPIIFTDASSCTLFDTLRSDRRPTDDKAIARVMCSAALKRIEQIMPEAIEIGELRLAGYSFDQIAAKLNIPRTTLTDRLNKLYNVIKEEFLGIFD